MMGLKIQTGASQREQQCMRGTDRMDYLDEGGRFCVGRLVDARMITALGVRTKARSKEFVGQIQQVPTMIHSEVYRITRGITTTGA